MHVGRMPRTEEPNPAAISTEGENLMTNPTPFRLVIVESPYAGDIEANEAYARAAMRDCLLLGDAPYASHLLYTQAGVLQDTDKAERKLGMEAGFAWGEKADATIVYSDLGISSGMAAGMDRAAAAGRPIEERHLLAGTNAAGQLEWSSPNEPATIEALRQLALAAQ